jgi:hypothetical protein
MINGDYWMAIIIPFTVVNGRPECECSREHHRERHCNSAATCDDICDCDCKETNATIIARARGGETFDGRGATKDAAEI